VALVTSARLAAAASELQALGDALAERIADFSDVIESARTSLELLNQTWRGPLPTEIQGEVSTYVEAIASIIGATESARATVDRWAAAAIAASEVLAGHERSLGSLDLEIAGADPDDVASLRADRMLVADAAADERAAWAQTCVSKGAELESAIATMQRCTVTEMGTVDQRSALLGEGYSFGMAAWAVQHDMDLGMLDPTGGLHQDANARLADFADDEHAALLYAVIETMNQADISKMDGKSSRDDWLNSTDPEIVRFRLEIAARLAGVDLTAAELDELTAQIVTLGVYGAATDGDGRGHVDDHFDENADIELALDNDEPAEHDVEFGDSDADQYIEDWLETQWENDRNLGDWVAMIVLPDFEVMNPWSDEFHAGWALVEVVGLIPFTKVAKLATLARLGSHVDEVTDAVRLLDEGVDLLSDSGRVADDVAAAGDDVLRAADDVPQITDDVAGAADDIPTHNLPMSDARVVAQIEEVRAPVLDEIQQQVDEIWDQTQDALPGASPQQLGTRAHVELERWITEHADELVDPDTGYRVRAEVSFQANPSGPGGIEAARGTAGSIRPDVVIERQVVDAHGRTTWEVVEVADLKTGRAGITTSWQRRVDDWIAPNQTTEIRPTPRVPVPE
jgi:hypothetical protein